MRFSIIFFKISQKVNWKKSDLVRFLFERNVNAIIALKISKTPNAKRDNNALIAFFNVVRDQRNNPV